MLADPGSRFIREFDMIDPDNTENNVPSYGMRDTAYPGYFVVNPKGVVVERFVDARYDDRLSGTAVVAAMFPELLEANSAAVPAAHIGVRTGQTDVTIALGTHVRLLVEVAMPSGMHVYAPGVKGYRPIALNLDASRWIKSASPAYPPSRTMNLRAIKETVPVYVSKVRIHVDVVVANRTVLMRELLATPDRVMPVDVTARLSYQACDEKVCYFPAEVPLVWHFNVRLPDRTRVAPENQQRP